MASIVISESEILAAIQSATNDADAPDGVFSRDELAQMLGIGEQAAYARIKKLFRAGLVEVVMVRRRGMDGIVRSRPGYRLLKRKTRRAA